VKIIHTIKCLNFQRKIPENIAELDNTLQGMLRGKERPLPTALKE
jgi:hypothetical protein